MGASGDYHTEEAKLIPIIECVPSPDKILFLTSAAEERLFGTTNAKNLNTEKPMNLFSKIKLNETT